MTALYWFTCGNCGRPFSARSVADLLAEYRDHMTERHGTTTWHGVFAGRVEIDAHGESQVTP